MMRVNRKVSQKITALTLMIIIFHLSKGFSSVGPSFRLPLTLPILQSL